jgi:acyl-CoA synthetase (AMP-forming)/AMP-acid ligase II
MLALDSIQEVAVVGLADEEWGQRVAAVVKVREGVCGPPLSLLDLFFYSWSIQATPLELPALRAELKNEMAPYKIPTVLKIVDVIERNAMGKVNKKTITQKYWPDKA